MTPSPSLEFVALQQAVAGRYSLDRELGRGGMGIVFLARDVALDRPVAIKLLPPALAAQLELRERFLREARTAASLSHPNIVPIHSVEQNDDLVYFAMAYVDGESLGQRVRRSGPLSPSAVSRLVQEVAWALAYAHGRGVIHRDIKPDNILLEKGSGRALVTDFGIARVADETGVTARGEILGTAHYMSPEQASGDATDARSDLYSLGVTAFFALAGTLPFDGANLPAVIAQVVSEPAPRIGSRRMGVPPRLAEAVDRCLAKAPAERYASGEALAEAVSAAQSPPYEPAPQIRHVIRVARELDVWLGMSFIILYLARILLDALWPADPSTLIVVGAVVGVQLLTAPITFLSAIRRVLNAGLGPADVKVALEHAVRSRLEEDRLIHGDSSLVPPADRRRIWRGAGLGFTLGGAGWFAIASMLGLGGTSAAMPGLTFFAIGVVIMVGVLGMRVAARSEQASQPRDAGLNFDDPLAAIRDLPGAETLMGNAPRRRAMGLGLRLLEGRVARWLFRLMGLGIHVEQQNLPPALERTELMLGAAAENLFKSLPSEVRRRFAEVPAVIDALEADAGRLRARVEQLGQALTNAAAPAGGADRQAERRATAMRELEAAREKAQARLAAAVAALENIRLDLLRLQAGVGSADDLTADLEAVTELGEDIEAELAGRAAVRALLRGGGPARSPSP